MKTRPRHDSFNPILGVPGRYESARPVYRALDTDPRKNENALPIRNTIDSQRLLQGPETQKLIQSKIGGGMRKPVTELAYVNMYDKPTITRHSRSVS